ncbi:MAG TPA: TetR family transcriptional regulator [Conexibacter sp.]|nr:TetR family transcriptional regulator [Conexibacter sp.]
MEPSVQARAAGGRRNGTPGVARPPALSDTEVAILEAVADSGAEGISRIATAAAVAQPTATRAVDRLERDGFVARTQTADDRRRRPVVLTATGRRALARGRRQLAERAAARASRGEEPPATAPDETSWDRRRRSVLAGAAEVFFERGFARGTTHEIAQRVGLSQPAIYHYVGSKEDLISEIAHQVDRDFSAALERSVAASDEPVAQLRGIIASFADTLTRNHRTFAVYWQEQHSLPEAVREETAADLRRYMARIDDVVAAVQQLGLLPAQAPTRVVTEGIIGMLSWMYWWYRPGGRYDAQQIADTFCEMLGLHDG